jgi:hypothetical protein
MDTAHSGTHLRGLHPYGLLMATIATPWGRARLVEQLEIPQEAGERAFATLVQLLEADGGERLVRFAYTTGGVARRGPVTLRAADLELLRAGLRDRREIARALGVRPR